MDKKLMIYPFNKQIYTVARYNQLLKGYELTAAVSPKNYGYEGSDISCMDGGDFSGITITSSFQEELAKCDSILFSSSTFNTDLNFIEEKMQEAFDKGKEVLITKELATNFWQNEKKIPDIVRILGANPIIEKISYSQTKDIHEVSIPVLTIFQVGKYCHGFETLLLMEEKLEKDGYRVCKVSSCDLGELFGIHMLPEFIYKQSVSYEDKIISLNRFLISLVENEQPDILLLEIEEAILPYNDRITNHFGVIPSIVTKAALPDISILNIYYNTFDKIYLDHLRSYCRYGLNTEIDTIGISNTTMVIKEFDSVEPVQYLSIDREKILHTLNTDYNNYDCSFFHAHDLNSINTVYHNIVDKLTHNTEIIRIW